MPNTILNVDHLHKRCRLGNVDRQAFKEDLITNGPNCSGGPIRLRATPPAKPTGQRSLPSSYCHTEADVRRVVETMNRF